MQLLPLLQLLLWRTNINVGPYWKGHSDESECGLWEIDTKDKEELE